MRLPDYPTAKEYHISPEGLQQMLSIPRNPQYPNENILWTTNFTTQLPIRLATSGIASSRPTTLIEQFRKAISKYSQRSALTSKINGVWFTLNYQQYYQECLKFANALLSYNLQQNSVINIIGFNAPEWFIAFYGCLFARCIPVGIYTTNNKQACEYIADHSQAKVVLAENREYANKYLNLLDKGTIKLIVIYNDPQYKPAQYEGRIISYSKFISEGERVDPKNIQHRVQKIHPGHCCTLVYTSGTTGMPKGVMLSHDNYTWTRKAIDQVHQRDRTKVHRIVSYLPLSHVAAQFSDIVGCMIEGAHIFFADPTALQGTLIQTLKEVKPTFFFSVPRVWEKVYEEMMKIAKSNGWLKTKIANWAKSLGAEGSVKERRNEETSWQFKIAKMIIFNNVKKALGLDECQYFLYGSAPLDPMIRQYFFSLNFFLINSYGMSESTGPQNVTNEASININGPLDNYKEVGKSLPGTEITIIKNSPNDEDGQICYRGRNVFMGYYKNPQETAKSIDQNGFLHSGDMGRLTPEGVLFITGRVKELIITAGGENIPPLIIENNIRAILPIISNVMIVGDMRKYLTCLITIKEETPGNGKLDVLSKGYLADRGCNITTVKEALGDEKVKKIISEGLKKANEKAISRAQHVQDFLILPEDFTTQNCLLTPTLKLKRKQVLKKYGAEIETLYSKPAL